MGDRAAQIPLLAAALVDIVPQAAVVSLQWAAKLYDDHHVRVAVEAHAEAPTMPDMAGPTLATLRQHYPEVAARVEAARTDEQRAALRAEVEQRWPDQIAAVTQQVQALDDTE